MKLGLELCCQLEMIAKYIHLHSWLRSDINSRSQVHRSPLLKIRLETDFEQTK